MKIKAYLINEGWYSGEVDYDRHFEICAISRAEYKVAYERHDSRTFTPVGHNVVLDSKNIEGHRYVREEFRWDFKQEDINEYLKDALYASEELIEVETIYRGYTHDLLVHKLSEEKRWVIEFETAEDFVTFLAKEEPEIWTTIEENGTFIFELVGNFKATKEETSTEAEAST